MAGGQTAAIRLAAAAAAHQAASGAGLGAILNVDEGRSRDENVTPEEEPLWEEGQAMSIEQATALALQVALATNEE